MAPNNTPELIKVLLVDDDEEDYLIIKRLFASMQSISTTLDWVSSSDEAIERIMRDEYDAYFIDYRIDGRTGLDVLQEVNAIERAEPFILLTGMGDRGIERESLQLAASDYLIKKNLTSESLAKALYYALGRKAQEKQKINQLLELNRSKDEFISIASHQLRTPATTVKQYVAMVLDGFGGTLTEKQQHLLTRAYESNERQLSTINNLLKVAQINAGTLKLAQKEMNVTEIVESAVQDLAVLFSEKEQKVTVNPAEPAMANVDENAIRMVIDNLLENASKYSNENTAINLSIQKGDDDCIAVTIADEGVGVDDPAKLFQKFSRIDNELSTTVGGTGLGLYWARTIAKLHGGDLTFEPNTPKGSKFTLHLPSVK